MTVHEQNELINYFAKKKKKKSITPTQNVLLQHSKRVACQAAPWELDSDSLFYLPVWNTLPVAPKTCNELVRCRCKNARGCSHRCE